MTKFWDREAIQPTHVSWMEPLVVRHYINASISGDIGVWPLEWFEREFAARLPFDRALSIGCGSGALERQLISRGVCRNVDAFDGSVTSINIARDAQSVERIASIHYFVADFNFPVLPPHRYDVVFFHHSLHHVTFLERLFRALVRTLKPGGLIFLDEYIGPSRTDWNEERLATHRRVLESLPLNVRDDRPLGLPIQYDDPSEAVRSSEILDRLKIGFRILRKRDYGGNFLSVLYPMLRQPASDEVLRLLIEAERQEAEAYHAVIVARRRDGLGAWIARGRYRVEGILRRKKLEQLVRGETA